jgi:hypothetical protein
VFELKKGTVHQATLQCGAAHGDGVEVQTADLEEGAEVIVGEKESRH